jgi:segregation and condensation protein B
MLGKLRTLVSHSQRPTNAWVSELSRFPNAWNRRRHFALESKCVHEPKPGSEQPHEPQNGERPLSKLNLAKDDQSPEVKCRILEAILLIAKEPLSARKLAAMAGLTDPTEARTLARKLNEQFDKLGHAFRIEEIAGGMQLLTRPQFATWLRRLEHVPGEELLSQGMLESLAIVAYRQPIMRAEIEAIRGVSCDEVLRQLMQRDVVRICGRHEDLGRPYLYGTSKRFLQLFGLQSLDSLPRAQKIRAAEAETASRLAGNRMPAQDSNVKMDLDVSAPHSA